MTAGLQTLSDTLDGSLSAEKTAQLQQVTDGLTQLQTGIQTLNEALQNTSMPDTAALTKMLTESLTAIGTSAQDAGAQLTAMQTALTAMTQNRCIPVAGSGCTGRTAWQFLRSHEHAGNRHQQHRHTGDHAFRQPVQPGSEQQCCCNGHLEVQR
ncbi:MAG: hypothetical protein ACLUSL_08635 [Ruminococcus sp.]